MPRPVDARSTYVPGLDGIRAMAVLAVLGYHFGVPHADGGLLGVSIFFTLSGFLITGILLASWERTGGLELGRFYRQRARRLLPALTVVLLAVLLVTAVAQPDSLRQRVHETVGAALYVSNWTTIANGTSYFDYFAGPQPLEHLWSLAIEEQFYLLWPVVLLCLLRLGGGSRRTAIRGTVALATASFLWMSIVTTPGLDHTRVYEGTDTRAGELLVGALLALVYTQARRERLGTGWRRAGVELGGVAALVVIGLLVTTTSAYSLSLYRGSLLALALATAVLVGAVVTPGSALGWVLGRQPLRWLGERSYGIYLWHMPVVAFTPQSIVRPFSMPLAALHLTLTLVLASLSWTLIEDPIRRRGLRGAFSFRTPHRIIGGRVAVPVLVGVLAVCVASVSSLSISHALTPRATLAAESLSEENPPPPPDVPSPTDEPSTETPHHLGLPPRSGQPPPRHHRAAAAATQTSCRAVVHVGDSTSVGLDSSAYLPEARYRIDAQYRDLGIKRVHLDIRGARSIVETYHGEPNAFEATKRRIEAGYDGCWVFAMGTNDTANQFVGGVVPMAERIDRVMKEIHGQPAMWLTVRTLLSSGPWAEREMQKWNDALLQACRKYPNMRVYDWASQARDSWYISDGIHFTSLGYRERAHRIAQALAVADPAQGSPPASCLVLPG